MMILHLIEVKLKCSVSSCCMKSSLVGFESLRYLFFLSGLNHNRFSEEKKMRIGPWAYNEECGEWWEKFI